MELYKFEHKTICTEADQKYQSTVLYIHRLQCSLSIFFSPALIHLFREHYVYTECIFIYTSKVNVHKRAYKLASYNNNNNNHNITSTLNFTCNAMSWHATA